MFCCTELVVGSFFNEKNELHNREMHISGLFTYFKNDDPINDPIKYKPDERELKIIRIITDTPGINRIGIAEKLGCSESTAKTTIQSMISKNLIHRVGSNKDRKWVVNPK